MKFILRSIGALALLLAFAIPLCAQGPNVGIRLDIAKECVKGTFKNMKSTTVAVSYVELWIYDAKTCKRICVTRKMLNQKIKACDTLTFELCCKDLPAASEYIYYVRVHHNLGINETWGFAP